ncbi:hypothetical protein H1R20_g5013, partial [Candolleomyces eurysporus]
MSNSDALSIWCICAEGSRTELVPTTQATRVRVQRSDIVDDLKLQLENDFHKRKHLVILRSQEYLSVKHELKDKIPQLGKAGKLEDIRPEKEVADLTIKSDEVLIIATITKSVPEHHVSKTQGKDVSESLHLKALHKDHRHLAMSANQRGVVTQEDLKLSKVIEEENPEDPIRSFEKELGQFRYIDRGLANRSLDKMVATNAQLESLLKEGAASDSDDNAPSDSNDNVPSDSDDNVPSDSNDNAPSDSNNAPSDSNDNAPPSSDNAFSGSHDITMSDINPEADSYKYTCSLAELHHMQMVWDSRFSSALNTDPKDRYDENLANAAIFFPFAFGLRRRPNFSFKFATFNWPFKMFIQVDEAVFSYHPRSDFLFTYGRLFQFIGEVQSQKNKADRNHMLLQAAYVVKFSNTLLKKHKVAKNFRLLTAYINNNGEVERSIVYQDKGNDDKVKYTTPRIFNLNKRYELLAFLRELYNFASRMEREYSDEDLEDAQAEMEKLESESSTSARHPDVRAWTARPKTDRGSAPEPKQQKPADGGDEFMMQLKAEGYEVEPQVIGDGSVDTWELEGPPPQHGVPLL